MRPTLTWARSCDPVIISENERHGGVKQRECKCGFLWKKAFPVEELNWTRPREQDPSVTHSLKFILYYLVRRWTYLVNKYVHWRINRCSSAICHRYESKAHSYIKPLTVACAVHGRGASAFQRLGTKAPSTIPHSSWQGKQDTRLAWATASGSPLYHYILSLRECVSLANLSDLLCH